MGELRMLGDGRQTDADAREVDPKRDADPGSGRLSQTQRVDAQPCQRHQEALVGPE